MAEVFNIRVYGIWIHEQFVLVNEEHFRGMVVRKFPGGGLEWGEGLKDCLVREWKEEIGIDIEVLDHLYTTDFFQRSVFDGTQIISIYYLVTAPYQERFTNLVPGEKSFWLPISTITTDTFTLPIDKLVGDMLSALYRQ